MLVGKANNFKFSKAGSPVEAPTSPEANVEAKAGFTLLEVLLALAILTIAVLTLMGLFPLGLKGSSQAKQITIATSLAQAKIEQIISQRYDEVASGDFEESSLAGLDADFSAFGRLTRVTLLDGNFNPSVQDVGLKKIEIFVSWPDSFSGKRSTTTLATVISNL